MLHVVQYTRRRYRLVTIYLLHKVRIETPEIYQLARRVDFRLVRRLARIEHGRGIKRLAIFAGQKFRRLEQNNRP